jgi:hypothetical protein
MMPDLVEGECGPAELRKLCRTIVSGSFVSLIVVFIFGTIAVIGLALANAWSSSGPGLLDWLEHIAIVLSILLMPAWLVVLVGLANMRRWAMTATIIIAWLSLMVSLMWVGIWAVPTMASSSLTGALFMMGSVLLGAWHVRVIMLLMQPRVRTSTGWNRQSG